MNRVAGLFVGICVASIILGVLIGVTDFGQWLPEATHQAVEIDFLFKFMIIASVFVFLLVHVYLLYFALRYRRRPSDGPDAVGAPIHGNTQLEIVWSILPAIFLVFLAALCFGIWDEMHTAKPKELRVEVIGHQFYWEFRYPQYGRWSDTKELNLPVNSAILFVETAPPSDVIHSFWVPEFRVKQDVVPGYTTYLRVQTRNVRGTFPVICTEFCGINHSQMVAQVHVLSQQAWLSWLHKRLAQAKLAAAAASKPTPTAAGSSSGSSTTGGTAQGQGPSAGGAGTSAVSFKADVYPIFQNHCAACHMNGQQMGGLNLSSYTTLTKGGSASAGGPVNGAVLVPGNHTGSYLWDAVEGTNLQTGQRMPLGGPYLSAGDIAKIAQWIDSGAKNN